MVTRTDSGSSMLVERRPQFERDTWRNVLLLQVAALELEMAQKRLSLYSKINSLSPIDQLPAELKTEIFYNALGSLVNTEWKGMYSEWEGMYPFFLGKICRSWRDFVWSTPILWSTLRLCLSEDRYEAQIDLLHDWLSRVSNHPISFCLDYEESPDEWDSHSPTEVLTTLASISSQWKDIELFLPDIKACFDAISTTGKSLPLLTTATIRFLPTSFSPELQLNLSMTPQLTVLHLSNPYLSKVLVPWHQLREFLAEGCTIDEIRIFFHNAPQIIHCTFKEINSAIMDHSLNLDLFHPLVLEHLECLKLCFSSLDESANWILGPAKLPSLREVSLRGPSASSATAAILLRIMQPFRCSQLLENFALSYEVPSEIILIQVLELVPSIKALRLHLIRHTGNYFLSEALLQRLYCPHNILLPNLQNFSYHGPTSLTEYMDLFRDVLIYRFRQCASPPKEVGSEQKTVSQIQSVTVDTSSQLVISPDIQEELDSLRRDGLDLSVTSHFVESRNFHEL